MKTGELLYRRTSALFINLLISGGPMEKAKCGECNGVFRLDENYRNDEIGNREIIIKGTRTAEEAAWLCGAIPAFFEWPHRNLLNSDGMSAAMKITGQGKPKRFWSNAKPMMTAFVYSSPVAITVSRVNDEGR
jgi:hypothetical protein